MKHVQPKLPTRALLIRLLVASLLLHDCSASSHPFIAKVQRSPAGVGTSAAFRKYSSRRSFLSSSLQTSDGKVPREQSDDFVSRDEVDSINPAAAQRRINSGLVQDEYDQSEVDALLSSNSNSIPATIVNTKADTIQVNKGGAIAARPLLFWENMISGAISRSVAQTAMHPANTMKTMMQSSRGAEKVKLGQLMKPSMFKTLSRGAGANFVLSIPHGAVSFAILEFVRAQMGKFVESHPKLSSSSEKIGPGLDFVSSAVSTICCSIVSTPQMMITDNIMAGNYPGLWPACVGLYQNKGIMGFYSGWGPGLAGKIPSYVSSSSSLLAVISQRKILTSFQYPLLN